MNPNQMFSEMFEKMQKNMEQQRTSLEQKIYEGVAGAGLVKASVTGALTLKKIDIDESLKNEPKEVMETLIASAVNAALQNAKENGMGFMKEFTKNLSLPMDWFKPKE